MASRLAQVERLNNQQAAKIVRQSREVEALRAELGILRRAAIDAVEDDEDDEETSGVRVEADTGGIAGRRSVNALALEVKALRVERDRYKRQVQEMTQFLADYGLSWVGDSAGEHDYGGDGRELEDPSCEPSEAAIPSPLGGGCPSPKQSETGAEVPMAADAPADGLVRVDIRLVSSSVENLNDTVEKAGAMIHSERGAGGAVCARLVANDSLPLPLTFFSDGVKLADHEFQEYSTRIAQQLIRDIVDGYFPFVLKEKYPDGATMKVVDRMSLTFAEWLQKHAHTDIDLVDGGDRLAPAGCVLRAPTSRVNGSSAAGLRLGGGNATLRGVSAPTASRSAVCESSEVSLVRSPSDPSKPAARLQVKFDGGRRVVFCMEYTQCVGDLEDALSDWLQRQRCDSASLAHGDGIAAGGMAAAAVAVDVRPADVEVIAPRRFFLRTAFPPRTYMDRAQTISDAGLTPSATLFVNMEDPTVPCDT